MRLIISAVIAAAAVCAAPAANASPESRVALDEKVRDACTEASGLREAVIAAVALRFSDRMPIEVRQVRGTPMTGPGPRTMLCLYDRRTGHAEVQEVPIQPAN